MRQKLARLAAAFLIYWLGTLCTANLLVMPSEVFRLSAFLPPLLGLMGGVPAALGVGLAEILIDLGSWVQLLGLSAPGDAMPAFLPLCRNVICGTLAAYLPYRLWHTLYPSPRHPFALYPKILLKFVLIIFLMTACNALILGLTATDDSAALLFSARHRMGSILDFMFLRTTTDFNLTLFFSMPIFIFLVNRQYPFHLPPHSHAAKRRPSSEENLLLPGFLYLFLLALFLLLDLSGAIYGLERVDVWQMFNLEIVTAMNIAMVSFTYILLRFRHSIMNDLMMLEVLTVCLSAFALGGISYMSMNALTDERVAETLDTMSSLSRERLSSSLQDIKGAVHSMHDLALRELASYGRFAASPDYRAEYIASMARLLYPIAANTDGSISFYLRCTADIAGPAAGFYWTRPPGHWEGTPLPFEQRPVTDLSQYDAEDLGWYYQPLRRHNPTWIEPYVDVNTQSHVISYSMPLYADGKPLGIIGMDIDFEYLVHEIRRMSVYEHGYAYLTDRQGRVLFHRDYPVGAMIPKDPNLYETETYLSSGIWLGIAVPAYDIYEDRNTMLIHLVVGMLLMAMAISFFSIWLAIRGIRPLLALTEAVKKIAAGNLDIKLSYDSRNELGTLVRGIREMTAKLEVYVYRDKLTGLRNTAAYMRSIEALKSRARDGGAYAVVVFDANFLKRTNDRYGHEAGNELIRRAASTICFVFAHSPVFRIGGDEFVALLEGHDYECREELLAEFDRQAARASFTADGHEIAVSVARGIGTYRPPMEYSEVFQEADAAMYEHKAALKASQGWTDPKER